MANSSVELAWWEPNDKTGSALQRRWSYVSPFVRKFGLLGGFRVARQMREVDWQSREPVVKIDVPSWPLPVWLRPNTTDSWVFRQQVLGGELELDIHPSPRRVIDGGANIGMASRVFASRWPEAQIVAVEMEPGNFGALRRNCADMPKIEPVHAALWSEPGTVGISSEKLGETGFRVDSSDATTTVPAVTIDMLADARGWDTIDLVKLDIEGAEREVLTTANRWLHRVHTLAVELHERFAPGAQAAFDALIDRDMWDVREHGEYVIATRR
jgi:FkbM family methyltransferase